MPTPAELRAAIHAHLARALGPPGETFILTGNPSPSSVIQRLEIPFFLPEQHLRHAVFATVGASAFVMSDGGRLEVMMVLAKTPPRPRFEAVHALLSSFATYPERNGKALDMGDVVPVRGLLGPFGAYDAVMLLPPVPVAPELARATLADGTAVDLAWLLPITGAEARYAVTHGPEVLMALFALERVDPTDVERRPLDTSRRVPDLEAVRALIEAEERRTQPRPATARAEVRGDVITITRRGRR